MNAIAERFRATLKPASVELATPQMGVEMEAVLRSADFARSPRMIRLLRFLVTKSFLDETSSLTEYAIGLNVFDRDPRCYHTCDDPIVRVQTGRLREKLKLHYDAGGSKREFRLTIPVGSYRPELQQHAVKGSDFTKNYLLAMRPVRCISAQTEARCFADGLSEELASQLFLQFGSQIVSPNFDTGSRTSGAASHFLEGSVRVCSERMRATFRLVDAAAGSIAWSEQFDRAAALTINVEETLAKEVCDSLRKYYCQT